LGVRLSRPRDLQPDDDFSEFDCGDKKLNRWARAYAHYNKRNRLNFIRVITARGGNKVLAFYALSFREIEYEKLGVLGDEFLERPPKSIPAYFICQLGVDASLQGNGIGGGLVKDIYYFVLKQSNSGIPAPLLYLDVASPSARAFWEYMGFQRCPDIAPQAMVRELAEIEDTSKLLETKPLLRLKLHLQRLRASLAKLVVNLFALLSPLGNRR